MKLCVTRLGALILGLCVVVLLFASVAHAAEGASVVIWPTLTPAGDGASVSALHRPVDTLKSERELYQHAQELDATLRDGAEDLGFALFVADSGPIGDHTRDQDLIERASLAGAGAATGAGTWVVS